MSKDFGTLLGDETKNKQARFAIMQHIMRQKSIGRKNAFDVILKAISKIWHSQTAYEKKLLWKFLTFNSLLF